MSKNSTMVKNRVIDEPFTASLKQICNDFSTWVNKQGNGQPYAMSDYEMNKAIIAKKEKALSQEVESSKAEEELNTSKQKLVESTSQNLVLSTQEDQTSQNKEESLTLAKQGQTTLSNAKSSLSNNVSTFELTGEGFLPSPHRQKISSLKPNREVRFYSTPGELQLHAKEKSHGFTNLTIQPTGQTFSENAKKPVITLDTWTKIIFLFQVVLLSRTPVKLAARVAVGCGKEICSKLVGLVSHLRGGASLQGEEKNYANNFDLETTSPNSPKASNKIKNEAADYEQYLRDYDLYLQEGYENYKKRKRTTRRILFWIFLIFVVIFFRLLLAFFKMRKGNFDLRNIIHHKNVDIKAQQKIVNELSQERLKVVSDRMAAQMASHESKEKLNKCMKAKKTLTEKLDSCLKAKKDVEE